MGNIHVVGPNEALVISGGCCGSSSKRFIIGGWAWTCCLVSDIQKLNLEVFTLNPKCEKIESKHGVQVNVDAVAQCKIDKSRVSIAAEMFLGKDVEYIKSVVLQTVEGHLRAVTGTLTMEEIFRERQTFANTVIEMASKDLENFGISLLSFTIKDTIDKVDYLISMGRKEIVKTKCKAALKVAVEEKNAYIQESKAELEIKKKESETNNEIEEKIKNFKTEQVKLSKEIAASRKKAEIAYELETYKIKKEIEKNKKDIYVIELEKKLEILEKKAERKKNELNRDIVLSAKAEAYRIEKLAEAEKYRKIAIAKAEADKIRKISEAQSSVFESTSNGEIDSIKIRANALKNYSDAGILQLSLNTLPKLAAEICAPLKKIDEIVLVNAPNNQSLSSNFCADASRLASEMPPVIKALTGVNLNRAFENLININPPSSNIKNHEFVYNQPKQVLNENLKLSLPDKQTIISDQTNKAIIDSIPLKNYPNTINSNENLSVFLKSPKSSSNLNVSSLIGSISNLSRHSKNSLPNEKAKSEINIDSIKK